MPDAGPCAQNMVGWIDRISKLGCDDGREMPDLDVGSGPIRQPRVAIVDDEPDIARIVARTATINGFEPIVVQSGRQLLALVERDPPDVIVIDMVMPDMEGNEILIALRQAGTLPKVILMTGHGDAYLGPPSRLAGDALVGTLQKPFRVAELGVLLRRAVGRE
jgi:DNA-binding response OmpR family regulator